MTKNVKMSSIENITKNYYYKTIMSNNSLKKDGYNYASQDESLVDSVLCGKILPKVIEHVPFGLPANIITICSNTCVFIAFLIAMLSTKGITKLWFAIPFLIPAYLIGDSLDGMQARKTKTGSPLGEYLDHFLDCFVNAELIIPVLVCYKIVNPWIVFVILCKAYITQAVAFWERYKNGHMYFGKFSSTEVILSFTVIITIAYFDSVVNGALITLGSFGFIQNIFGSSCQWLQKLTIAEAVVCTFVVFSLISDLFNFIRTRGASIRFWAYCAASILVAILFAIRNPDYHYIPYYIVVLFNIDYIASLIVAITMKKTDPHADYIFVAFVVIAFVLKLESPVILIVELAYVLVKIIVRAVWFITKHRRYWVWKNPPLPQEN